MFSSSTVLEFLLFILQPLVLVSGYSGSDCSCRPACPPVRTPFCQPACLVCSQSTCHGRTYLLPELCSSKSVTLTGNSQNCFLSSSSSKKTYSYIRQSCRREHNGKKNKKLLLISKCVWSQAENVLSFTLKCVKKRRKDNSKRSAGIRWCTEIWQSTKRHFDRLGTNDLETELEFLLQCLMECGWDEERGREKGRDPPADGWYGWRQALVPFVRPRIWSGDLSLRP